MSQILDTSLMIIHRQLVDESFLNALEYGRKFHLVARTGSG